MTFAFEGKWWGRHPGMYKQGSIVFDRWYDVKVEVRGSSFRGFLDGTEVFRLTDDRFTHGRLGFGGWDTIARFRDIEVTATDGRVLWKGP